MKTTKTETKEPRKGLRRSRVSDSRCEDAGGVVRKKPRLRAIAEREGKSDRYLVTIFLGERPAAHSRSMSKAESDELVAKINDAPEREQPLEEAEP